MTSYTPYLNQTQTYPSVITKSDDSNRQSTKEPNIFSSDHPNILPSAPDIELEYIVKPKRFKKYYPGPSLDTHGCYTFHPPNISPSSRTESLKSVLNYTDLTNVPPLAHSSNTRSMNVCRTFSPVESKPIHFQREPLDLVCLTQPKSKSSTTQSCIPYTQPLLTGAPLRLNSSISNVKIDHLQATANKANQLDSLSTSTTTSTTYTSIRNVLSIKQITENIKADEITVSSNIPQTDSMVISPIFSEPIQSNTNSPAVLTSNTANISTVVLQTVSTANILRDTLTTTFIETTPVICSTTSSSDYAVASTVTAVSTYDSRSTTPPVLTPVNCPEIIKNTHHKLKKTWLQRHVWAEDHKESCAYMGPSTSTAFFSQIDDTPPVLQCEDINNIRNIRQNITTNNGNLEVIFPQSNSSTRKPIPENDESISSGYIKDSGSKRKIVTKNDSDTDTAASETNDNNHSKNNNNKNPDEKQIMVKIPLKMEFNDGEQVFFQSGPCLNVGSKIHKCRECLIFMENEKKINTTQYEIDKIFCRFYAFRRLFTDREGQLIDSGFPDPYKDITAVS